jgi:hypothetical protein
MKARARQFLMQCLVLLLFLPVAFAQDNAPLQQAGNVPAFTQQELDQMLASVALYPDSLLTQILMASTYPLEVVEAARWSRANPGLNGEQAVRAVEQRNWDPSVKSLVAFPQVLQLMDGTLEWTEGLGDAFLSQEPQVWDTVQNLRQRAYAAGNLQSNDQLLVEQDGPAFVLESPRPDVIYVPYYDPLVVYGDWWWPGYAPMRWGPWPGYYARPLFGGGYYWGSGITVGIGFFFGGVDWRLRHGRVVNTNSFYYRNVNRRPLLLGNVWQHDPAHRRGVPYRNPVLRQQFIRTPASPDVRREFRGRVPTPGTRFEPGDHGSAGPSGTRQQFRDNSPGANVAPRPADAAGARPVPVYPGPQGATARPFFEQRPHALEGIGQGQDARNASVRGHASSPPPLVASPPRPPAASNTPRFSPPANVSAPRSAGNAPSPAQHTPADAPRQRGEPQR